MSSGKRYFSPQGGPPNKRKSQQPYFVDKRLTPRVNEYLNSYGQENKSDVDGIVDYLQMSFPEYGRKKRLSLRQSVVKVISSSPKPTLDNKGKLQKQFRDGDRASDDSSLSSEEEELVEAKDTNIINNSMHNLYSRVTRDLMSKSSCEDSVKVDGENEITNKSVTGQARGTDKVINSSIAELQNEILDKVKSYDMSTPVPSPGGSKSGKSDDEKLRRSIKRRKNRDNEDGKIASGKHAIKTTESTLKLSDVGGYENALEEVMKLLFHLKHPEVFQRLGVKPPRGFLLHGPPGCGKTLLANAIAGELQLPYFKLAATEVISGVSGESEEKLRELFVAAQQVSPSIIFLDEIDAIAPNRESASKEMERRIVSQLLVCMDDLDQGDSDVLLIGATNRPDSLDPALRRAGRFDREICLGMPDQAARKRILNVVCDGLRLADNFQYDEIASLTPGFVGADLVSLTREAAMFAVQRIFQNIEEKVTPPAPQSTEESQNCEETPVKESLKSNEIFPDARFKAISWVKDQPPLPSEELDRFFIEIEDFKNALTTVQPSAKREGFATVPDVTWQDIGALEDIRDELSLAILAPVRHYEEFKSLGIANPPGILLAGPPGCGKTLLAKAIANEAGINFISVKGPELLNMYVGESERAVRQVFQRARNSAPCVIFFDEIDALCPKRSEMGESSASSRVVNQLLTEMDGLVVRKQVFLMGATNRPDIIDPAILRPGRLDKILFVGIPEPEDRVKILRTVTKSGTQPRLAEDVDLEQISQDARCERYSGADLAALVREASVQTLKDFMRSDTQTNRGKTGLIVTMQHFEQAFTKLRPSVSLESKNWYDKLRAKFGIQ